LYFEGIEQNQFLLNTNYKY